MNDYLEQNSSNVVFNLPQPRKWQDKALVEWKKNTRGIAKVVTGGGKTVFAGMCANSLNSEKLRVFIIVPTKALRDQWFVNITMKWNFNYEKVAIDKTSILTNGWEIAICVVNTARTINHEIQNKEDIFLIADECHTAGTEKNRVALEGNWRATLGLSATPERQYDDFFEEVLIPRLGNVIVDYDYSSAAKDKVISKFKLSNHRVDFTGDEQAEYEKITRRIAIEKSSLKKSGMNSSDKLERLFIKRASISKNAELRLPVAATLIARSVPKKTILFHESIHQIEALSLVLADQGIDCRTYHSKMSDVRRLESLGLFVSGAIEVLLTCRALDEGFDLPDIEVGIIASMTKSPRQRIQRLGRILRKLDGKTAEIKTIHTFHEDDMLRAEASNLNDALEIKWFG